MRIRPISPSLLVEELSELIAPVRRSSWARVAVDGAPAACPEDLADSLVAPLRLLGREVVRVSAWDFLRPASLRLEHGRTDPDVFYTDWLDTAALTREVLAPLELGGTGEILPDLWDRETDRATRTPYTRLPPGGVLLVDGTFLLGGGLRFDHTVHLWLSSGALGRRVPGSEHWTLPAYARYESEADPVNLADVAVRYDDPRHPALVESPVQH